MSNNIFKLNKTTKTLGNLFPALLLFTPAVAFAGTIDQSTSVPQNFSADTEYVINKDVTITSSGNEAAVSVNGINVSNVANMGNISGNRNGVDISTGAQRVVVSNEEGATISSTSATGVNIESMQGTLQTKGILQRLKMAFSSVKILLQLIFLIPRPDSSKANQALMLRSGLPFITLAPSRVLKLTVLP